LRLDELLSELLVLEVAELSDAERGGLGAKQLAALAWEILDV
jgi:hypothetical protein